MKTLRRIAVITLIVVVQLLVLMQFTFGSGRSGNLMRIPYRQTERAAAWRAESRDPSPENIAAFNRELQLALRFNGKQQLMFADFVFALLLTIEGGLLYLRRKYRSELNIRRATLMVYDPDIEAFFRELKSATAASDEADSNSREIVKE